MTPAPPNLDPAYFIDPDGNLCRRDPVIRIEIRPGVPSITVEFAPEAKRNTLYYERGSNAEAIAVRDQLIRELCTVKP